MNAASEGDGTRPAIRVATGTIVKDYDWYRRWLQVAEASGVVGDTGATVDKGAVNRISHSGH
jgi:hypothetical protein